MSRSRKKQDEMSGSEPDSCDEIVEKFFRSEDEFEASNFSGFSPVPSEIAENTHTETEKIPSSEMNYNAHDEGQGNSCKTNKKENSKTKGPGKGPGKNKKGKAPVSKERKRTNQDEPGCSYETSPPPPKRSKKKHENSKSTPHCPEPEQVKDSVLKSLFADLSKNIMTAITQSKGPNKDVNSNEVPSVSESDNDHEQVQVDNNHDNLHYNLFGSDTDLSEHEVANNNVDEEGEDFDFFNMPKIFEDDNKFGEDVHESVAKAINTICHKKSDVSSITKDLKIHVPGNCRA